MQTVKCGVFFQIGLHFGFMIGFLLELFTIVAVGGAGMSLENIDIPVDARKRELLEARFFESRVSSFS